MSITKTYSIPYYVSTVYVYVYLLRRTKKIPTCRCFLLPFSVLKLCHMFIDGVDEWLREWGGATACGKWVN